MARISKKAMAAVAENQEKASVNNVAEAAVAAVVETARKTMVKMHISCMFISECLGTAPASLKTYADYICKDEDTSAERKEDELKVLANAVNLKVSRLQKSLGSGSKNSSDEDGEDSSPKSLTIFPCLEDGTNVMFDYQIRGFFKESCQSLRLAKGSEEAKNSLALSNFKKRVDGNVFVYPHMIPIKLPEGMESTLCSRSLRAQTAKGERITLAFSEAIPAGSTYEFDVFCSDKSYIEPVKEWLNYGRFKGMLQWRSGGKGQFLYKVVSTEMVSSDQVPIRTDSSNPALAGKTEEELMKLF